MSHGEISGVDEVVVGIIADLYAAEAMKGKGVSPRQVIKAIRPYLRTTGPVSLADVAFKVRNKYPRLCKICSAKEICIFIFEASGVACVE